jgi:Zn-dependent protease with chaperone function
MTPIPLLGLRADQFRHPLDREATRNLKRIPGLDLAIRGWLGGMAEQYFYMENIASSIRVGPEQLPWLHNLLLDACKILDLEVPQLYVRQNPVPNAYTMASGANSRL